MKKSALAYISHHPPATTPQWQACAALFSAWVLNVLLSMPPRPTLRTPCIRQLLRRLATARGERCGLAILLVALTGCTGDHNGNLSVAGQIEGTSVDAGSKVGGRVEEVFVAEGDWVKKGDSLVELESTEADAAVSAARARLVQAEAQLAKIEEGAREEEIEQARAALQRYEEQYRMALRGAREQEKDAARAAVEAAAAEREAAREDYERAKRLVDTALPRRDHDMAKHRYEAAEAQLKAAKKQLEMVLEGPRAEEVEMAKAARDQAGAALKALEEGARKQDIETARALRNEAEAAVHMVESTAREMLICAPMDGVIESIDVHPGDLVKPGALVRVSNPDHLELKVFVSAYILGHVHLGQNISLTTDSHGDEEFEGEIVFIATEGEYTPRNLQTQEERVQQMFEVKLRLDSYDGKLKAGMTATAHFEAPEGESG